MSRWLPWLAELQPEMFAEIDPILAAERGHRGRRLDGDRDRARRDRGARPRDRAHAPAEDRRPRRPPDRAAVALGLRRAVAGRHAPTTSARCPATRTSRSRRTRRSPCNVRAGPPHRRDDRAPEGRARRQPRRARRATRPPRTRRRHDRDRDRAAGRAADGLLHRHDGVHRLQGVRGRLQAVERPALRRRHVPQGRLLRLAPGGCRGNTWRHVRFVELADAGGGVREDEIPDLVGRRRPANGSPIDVEAAVAAFDNWVFMSDVCKHCTNAGCLDACPTGALIRTEFETVVLQPDVCNGCGYCVPACPFGVVDRAPEDGRAGKCTLCYDRLEDGLEPACAKACPTDSIQFGPYDELVEVAERRVADAARARRRGRLPLRRRRRARAAARGRPRRVLPAHREARALRPAGAGRVADPGERRARHARRDGRRAARRRRRRRRVPVGEGAVSREFQPAVGTPASPDVRRAQRREGRRCTSASGRTAAGRTSSARTPTTQRRCPTSRRSQRAAREARTGELPDVVQGPVINAPVWTWEVPLYFWFGGIAAGSSFVALACDLAGDEDSARGRAQGRARPRWCPRRRC